MIEHIVDQCAYHRLSLHSFSLACRSLSPRTRGYLLHNVKVHDLRDLYRLHEFLDLRRHVRLLIHVITLRQDPTKASEWRNLLEVVPATLFNKLPNLSQWVVKTPGQPPPEQLYTLSFRHVSAAYMRTCTENIQTLELNRVSFARCSELALYLFSFPALRNLSCVNIVFREQGALDATRSRRLVGSLRLKSLEVSSLVCVFKCISVTMIY